MTATAQAARLPAGLAPWAEALSALTPGLALALGPLVRRIDELVGEREPLTAREGALDGYGGLARAGRPELLLASEWLLAEELPEEFLRRAASGELLHIAPEFRQPGRSGRVVVLVDAGPAQAGAGRLVQLAALVVLHRRAAARDSELVVGVLGTAPDGWLTGDLARLLPRWLAARRDTEPDAAAVDRATEALDDADEAWLLTSPGLAADLPARRRTLASSVCGWSADGATTVRIALGGGVTELPLPERELAVRALRGAEFRRRGPAAVALPPSTAPRLPVFNGPSPTLLARTGNPHTLVSVRVPERPDQQPVRVRRHDLPGQVVAAARIGRRLVTLVAESDRLMTYVIGRALGSARREPVDRAQLGLDDALLAGLLREPVLPVLLDGAALLCPLAGRWRRILPDGSVRDDGAVSSYAAPGFSRAREARLHGDEPTIVHHEPHRVFGAAAMAWSTDGEQWLVRRGDGSGTRIVVPPGVQVIGLAEKGEATALLTLTTAGLLLRSVRPDGSRTLSRLSGGASQPVVHPTLPLVAAEPTPGRIVVGDAFSGRIHLTVGSGA